MNKLRGRCLVLLALALLTQPLLARELTPKRAAKLNNDIRYLVSKNSQRGQFAVAVVDADGVVCAINAKKAFPLASVFKLPILVAVLKGQEDGTFPSAGTKLTVNRSDQCIGSGRLARQGLGAQVTVDKACRLMMSISDNTATDLLFRKLGTHKLDKVMSSLGFSSSAILLTNRQAWLLSLGQVPGWGKTRPEERVSRWRALNKEQKLALGKKIEQGASNMSLSRFQQIEDASLGTQTAAQDRLLAAELDNKMSALDLARLLVELDQGKLLSSSGSKRAFEILSGQKYHTRLPKKLSPGTGIYHKTGTLSGVRNDAGIMFVPGRENGIAVVFLSKDVKGEGAVDRLAAQIAKLVEQAYREK